MSSRTTRRSRRCRLTILRRSQADDRSSRIARVLSTSRRLTRRSCSGPSAVARPRRRVHARANRSKPTDSIASRFNGTAGTGSGETIAIVDAYDDPNIQADLNTFDSEFGLPATTVTRVNETGGTSYPASDPTGGWELEESLDVEWAHAMAPGASIMLVEASSTSDTDLLAAVKLRGGPCECRVDELGRQRVLGRDVVRQHLF